MKPKVTSWNGRSYEEWTRKLKENVDSLERDRDRDRVRERERETERDERHWWAVVGFEQKGKGTGRGVDAVGASEVLC